MPLNIPEQFYSQIIIDGNEFPISTLPGGQIWANQNVKVHLPVLKMILEADYDTFSTSCPVNDGTTISFVMNDGVTNQAVSQNAPFQQNQNTQPLLDSNSGTYSFGTLSGLSAAQATMLVNQNSTPSSAINNSMPTTIPPISYRAFGTPKRMPSKHNKGLSTYTILALLDNMTFLRGSPSRAFSGTSTDVMNQAALTLNFDLNTNVRANDKMNWLPGKKTWANFLQHVVRHSYVDQDGVMSMAVDEQNNLHYHNLAELFSSQKPIAYIFFGQPKDNSFGRNYLAIDFQVDNKSGMNNHQAAYGLRTHQMGLDGTSNVYNAVNATTANNSLDISGKVASEVKDKAKLSFAPSDCGNGHTNYIQARHQNERLRRTYSQNVYVMLGQTSGLQLHDLVKFTASGTSDTDNASVDGVYAVTAITRLMHSARYFEKIELTSTGPANANTDLASQQDFSQETG